MNLNEELKALLLSENEEDCRLAFEICKRKKVRVKEINAIEDSYLSHPKGIIRAQYTNLPMFLVIVDYLESTEGKCNKNGEEGYPPRWYKWRKTNE